MEGSWINYVILCLSSSIMREWDEYDDRLYSIHYRFKFQRNWYIVYSIIKRHPVYQDVMMEPRVLLIDRFKGKRAEPPSGQATWWFSLFFGKR